GLARAVRPEQADRFAAPDRNAYVLHHHPAAIAFAEVMHGKHSLARDHFAVGGRRGRSGTARAEPPPSAPLLHFFAGEILAHRRALMSHESASGTRHRKLLFRLRWVGARVRHE